MRHSSLTRIGALAALSGVLCLAPVAAATGSTTDPNTTSPKKKTAKTATSGSSKSSSHKKHSQKKTKSKSRSAKTLGQKAIDLERTRQIQEALIRERYMSGEPSGKWDDATQAALRRYQADQGWQSKSVPDSRALIKLGLGPSHDHLLNPETAMTTAPGVHANPSKPSVSNPVTPPAHASDATPHE